MTDSLFYTIIKKKKRKTLLKISYNKTVFLLHLQLKNNLKLLMQKFWIRVVLIKLPDLFCPENLEDALMHKTQSEILR